MNIETEKKELAKLILETENQSIIESVRKVFMQNMESDFWDNLSLDQKDEIERATKEMENGEAVDYDSFIQKYR